MDWKTRYYRFPFFTMVYRFNTIPIKIPTGLFFRNQQDNSKIYMERHRDRSYNGQKQLEEEAEVEGLTLFDFKRYITIQTSVAPPTGQMPISATKQRGHDAT